MRKFKSLLFVTSLLVGFIGCNNTNSIPKLGSLEVQVSYSGIRYFPSVFIYTYPNTEQGYTDQNGYLYFENIPIGTYEVYADIMGEASGKSLIEIKDDITSKAAIILVRDSQIGINPLIEVSSPQDNEDFAFGEDIEFDIRVTDNETPSQFISTVIESSLDEILFEGFPDSNGKINFTTNSLSRGSHTLSIISTDSTGYKSKKIIRISTLAPNAVTLKVPQISNGKVLLEWTQSVDDDFLSYDVFRKGGSTSSQSYRLVKNTYTKSETTFTDESDNSGVEISYYVRVTNKSLKFRNSNVISISN